MNKNIHTIVEMDKDRLTIAFVELSIGAASSEAKVRTSGITSIPIFEDFLSTANMFFISICFC